MKVIHSTKELPIYALVLVENDQKFSKSAAPDIAGNNFSSTNGQAMLKDVHEKFCEWLSREVGRKVMDQTGLDGKYDFAFHWKQERLTPMPEWRHRWDGHVVI